MRTALNLLPPASKEQLRSSYVLAHAQSALLVLAVVSLFVAGTLFGVRWLLKEQYDDLAARSVSDQAESQSVSAQIRDYNGYLARIDEVQKRALPYSPMLASLGALVPGNAVIKRVSLGVGGVMLLSGTAETREALLELESNLKKNPQFRDVKSPISNITQKTDIDFDFSFTYVTAADLEKQLHPPAPPAPVAAPVPEE